MKYDRDNIRYGDIKVSPVASMDARNYAWYISRGTEAPLMDIEKLDLTANSLKVVALELRTSVAFRELLTTIRPHFMWSQTSRVLDLEQLEIPYYYNPYYYEKGLNLTEELNEVLDSFDRVYELLDSGVHQDTARMKLPLAYLSSYVMAMDFRTWISVLKSLKVLHPFYYNTYGELILEKLRPTLELEEYPYGYAIPVESPNELFYNTPEFFEEHAGNVIAKSHISMGLRAQLARHIRIALQDEIWYMNNNHDNFIETFHTDDEIEAIIACPLDTWNHLVSHRACWIAHTEIWSGLIRPYLDKVGLKAAIPCHGKQKDCPFKLDNVSRVEGRDPGIPCPVFTVGIYDMDKRVELVLKRGLPKILREEWIALLEEE